MSFHLPPRDGTGQFPNRPSLRESEVRAYRDMSDFAVGQKPMVPAFVPDYSKPVGLVLIALAIGIGLAKWLAWVVETFAVMK